MNAIRPCARAPILALCAASLAAGGDQAQRAVPPRDGTWNQRPGAGEYKIVMEVSGRAELAPFRPDPSNPRSFEAVCEARKEALAVALPTYAQEVDRLARQPQERQARDLAWARHDLGQLWAYRGRMDEAIAEFEGAQRALLAPGGAAPPGLSEAHSFLEAVLGVLELRRGELENCLHDRNAARCMFPIEGPGPTRSFFGGGARGHALPPVPRNPPRRPRGALAPQRGGDDPGTLPAGRAQGVPHPSFRPRLGGGPGPLQRRGPRPGPRRARPRDRTAEAGLAGQLGGINVTQADYDNDGRLDLFVMRGGWESPMRNSLLRQNPDGTFTDVTLAAGLARVVRRTHSAAWADYDRDGWLDLFVGHEESPSPLPQPWRRDLRGRAPGRGCGPHRIHQGRDLG